jgi:hypothetical protein
MTDFALDPAASHLKIRTYAEGMLSALAHDLELEVTTFEAEATVQGEAFAIRLTAPVSAIRVAGVLKRGSVDREALKPGDKADIEQKVRREVLDAPAVEVHGEGTLAVSNGAGGGQRRTVEVSVGPRRASISTAVTIDESPDGYRLRGRSEVRLSALKIKPVKGPLGAFRLKDTVEIAYELTLRRRSS